MKRRHPVHSLKYRSGGEQTRSELEIQKIRKPLKIRSPKERKEIRRQPVIKLGPTERRDNLKGEAREVEEEVRRIVPQPSQEEAV